MSDVRYLSKKFLTEFIDLYKSLPSLWNLKSKEYYDRPKKNADYGIMVKKLKQVEPAATREMVRQKINSIRASRRKEMAKVRQSIEAGGEVYEPKLWYYRLMDFVDDQATASENASSLEYQIDADTSAGDAVTFVSHLSVSPSNSGSTSNQNSEPEESSIAYNTPTYKRTKLKRKLPRDKTTSYEAFGRYIAHKLENLPSTQRIFVEKIINDAIFEAELGNLNRKCYVHVPGQSDTD